MNRYLLFFFLFLISKASYSQSYSYAHYTKDKLSSKEFFGRGYRKDGDRIAANFIKEELEKSHLKPYNGSYFQYFDIQINNIVDAKLRVGDRELRLGEEFLVFGYSPSVEIRLKNEKTLILNSLELYDRKSYKKLNNKTLVINRSQFEDGQISKFIIGLNRLKISPKLIIVQEYEKIPFYSRTEVYSFPIVQLKGKMFKNRIKSLSLDIESEFNKNYRTQNVIAYAEGKAKKDSLYVFTAHYDHLGIIGDSVYFPGANDNASGVAVLLDLAKYYSKNPSDYTIVFVFSSAEEIGILGSFYLADNPVFDLDKIKFLINIDMAGTGSGGIALVNGKNEPRASNLFESINKQEKLFNEIRVGEGSCNSDHCPFVEKGVPGLFLFTFGCEYNEYHTIYDDGHGLPFTKHIDFCNIIKVFIEKY